MSAHARGRKAGWRTWLRIGVSFLLLALLLKRVDWLRLLALWQRARWLWLAWPVTFLLVAFGLSALRWQTVLRDLGLRHSLKHLWRINLEGFFWSQFLPTTVGGDGYRFWRLQREHPQARATVFTAIFLDRLYGYLALLGVHLALLPWTRAVWQRQPWLRIGEGLLLLGCVGLALAWPLRGFVRRMSPRVPAPLRPWFARVEQVWAEIQRSSSRAAALSLAYSALFVVSNGVMLWGYLRVLDIAAPLLTVLYASTLAALLGALPVSLNGLGLTEAALVLALQPVGLSREGVLLASFLRRTVNALLALYGGLAYAWDGAAQSP